MPAPMLMTGLAYRAFTYRSARFDLGRTLPYIQGNLEGVHRRGLMVR